MLDNNLVAQLTAHFEKISRPIELLASLDDSPKSRELRDLLTEIAALSDYISFSDAGTDDRQPSFAIRRTGTDVAVAFAGIPLGHEFTSLVLALLQVGGHPSTLDPEMIEQIQSLEGEYQFETFYSLTCQLCPDVVQALNLMSVLNPNITHVAIDGAMFQDEVERRQVMGVPSAFLDGELFESGHLTVAQILARLDSGTAERDAARMRDMEPFEVLIVGGGPAGAAAAIYAARKGIRTGIVAERFGGQVLDTVAIENFISVPYTEGPKLVAALETHVKEYDVEIMDRQRAVALRPAQVAGGLIGVELENGATLSSRTVIISTGARWRAMNVPGESDYRTKGVTECPHCDGPLYKNKRVAVIGGGNSGVEAAIDLAGVVDHVTLLEFDPQLRADAVLQRKLNSLPNTTVLVSALTTEVIGDGSAVTGLRYTDRTTDQTHDVGLEGIFVQIGLLPNTSWIKDSVELSARGEVVIDANGQTSVPGVFAAGDCTTVPYKQIVIALGAGSTASLSAFDYLIRNSAPSEAEAASVPTV